MKFEFQCDSCGQILEVRGPIGKVPRYPTHCAKVTRRLYTSLPAAIQWGRDDYMERAYDGSETVPGMSQQEVRETIDNWS